MKKAKAISWPLGEEKWGPSARWGDRAGERSSLTSDPSADGGVAPSSV